ncbi:MAG: hypothetical protein AAGB16_02015 [Pseudomonadota bacterium]
MSEAQQNQTGLRLGLIILGVVAVGFLGLFLFGPEPRNEKDPNARAGLIWDAQTVLGDAPSHRAIEALNAANPAVANTLDKVVQQAVRDDGTKQDIAALTLEALFAQFRDQAYYLQFADSAGYQDILEGLSEGLSQLEASRSSWCKGPRIAEFLAQNDDELVPALLAEFPYASPQYEWAMGWMETVLTVAKRAQDNPKRYTQPTGLDESQLQQEGLALGTEQWALALQIAAFANSEGVSYAKMQEVITGMDVCKLGMAVETVSGRLPEDVRGRIWADLMPEIMVGNTPYVMWRVTDYFFIN